MYIMKKTLIFMLLLVVGFFFTYNLKAVNAETDINYNANFTNGLPSDWSLYNKSATSQTTSTNGSGNVSIKHAGSVQAASYYGALYEINPNTLNNVGDFTFEMKFSVKSWEDTSRWFGVMYHTKKDSNGNLTGYMMNYRVSGKSAQSTITQTSSGATFTDSMIKEQAGNALSDKQTHTLKIVCSSKNVSHYMDNTLITSYELKDYSSGLSEVQLSGGFALIVNRMELNVTQVKITGKEFNEKIIDNTITSTYDPQDNFVGDVGVVVKINSKEMLNDLVKDNVKPTTAFIYVDSNMNATDSEGNSLNMSINDLYRNYLYQRIIPAFYIKDLNTANKFITYYKENIALMDAFVVSNDPSIVKLVRDELYYLRGIVDYSESKIEESNWKNLVKESNSSYANVVILNPKDATYDAIRYIQARFKTVWIDNSKMSKIDVLEQVVNGAYGIIYDDFRFVYDTIKSYSETNYMMNRVSYNIAHRGLCFTVAENSLEGYIESYNNGATHIEIDIRLTKDNQIVIMHDATIDRTTNGTGNVADMTLAQIQNYKIDSYYDALITDSSKYTKIPSLDEVFKEFKDKDIVLVVEIKSYELELVKQLKTLIEKYDMAENMVVITFSQEQLINMKNVLPEIPTASLTSVDESVFTNTLTMMANYNCGYDGHYGTSTETYVRKLALRGYSSWFWTYQREENIWVGMYSGTLGITNNEANKINDYALRIEFENDLIYSSRDTFGKEQATIVRYDETYNSSVLVLPVEIEEYEGYAYVIYKYTYSNGNRYYNIYSDKVLVITKSLAEDLDKLENILSKDVKDLTNDDVTVLERLESIASDLEEKGISNHDENEIKEKIEAYNLYQEEQNQVPSNPEKNEFEDMPTDNEHQEPSDNPQDSEPSTSTPTVTVSGCGGSIISSILGIFTLVIGIFIFRKKKN